MKSSIITHADILSYILRHADTQSLSRCMQVSWSFFALASPLLYSKISITPDNVDSIFRGANTGPMIYSDCTEREMKRDLLGLVKNLSVKQHKSCDNVGCIRWKDTNIRLPSLKILRTYLSAADRSALYCSWTSGLEPRTWVVRDNTRLAAVQPYIGIAERMPRTVKKVVITFRQLDDLIVTNDFVLGSDERVIYGGINQDLEVVLIFWMDGPTQKWNNNKENDDAKLSYLDEDDVENIVQQLTICASVPAKRLIICNLDKLAMEDKSSGEVQKFVSSQVEGTMKDWLSRIGRQREIKDRLGVIDYMGFEQYLRQENWEGEFDTKEVEAWL